MKGNLKADYDVHHHGRRRTSAARGARARGGASQPYQRSDKYKFLGMYGETADMSGGSARPGLSRIM